MDIWKPGINSGCHTIPTSVVCAVSGFKSVLPAVTLMMFWLVWPVTWLLKEPLAPTGGGISSDRLGARMSRDCKARKVMPGRGVFHTKPTFQVLASTPEAGFSVVLGGV